ncbi:alpha/beta hydrolase family protein [Leptospira broomii serovar Hurstbridge str. 5399]|uniref:Alpha/beta hydrolase family protein n=1 Tax=Leptospira broomii serovar Hurstbridge str. 5399 TaxID=1049789 RepID=T0EZN8_9LEPT|nr:alpha/beta hydrolase [Leptospira broomii]EQA44370.1 alpha/beta hydrolase family protein [Leptospira broomii serovar Hurstbridge str. 5399]
MERKVVIAQGLWCRSSLYVPMAKKFQERGYSYSIPELRNTEIGEDGNIISDSNRYLEILQKHSNDWKNTILIGHSFGGLLAQIIAARVKPKALVLLSSVVPIRYNRPGLYAIAFGIYLTFISKFFTKSSRPSLIGFSTWIYQCLPSQEKEDLYPFFLNENPYVVRECVLPGRISRIAYKSKSEIECPVFVAAAARDRIVNVESLKNFADRYGAGYKVYENTSHWMITESSIGQIVSDICDWLDKK